MAGENCRRRRAVGPGPRHVRQHDFPLISPSGSPATRASAAGNEEWGAFWRVKSEIRVVRVSGAGRSRLANRCRPQRWPVPSVLGEFATAYPRASRDGQARCLLQPGQRKCGESREDVGVISVCGPVCVVWVGCPGQFLTLPLGEIGRPLAGDSGGVGWRARAGCKFATTTIRTTTTIQEDTA